MALKLLLLLLFPCYFEIFSEYAIFSSMCPYFTISTLSLHSVVVMMLFVIVMMLFVVIMMLFVVIMMCLLLLCCCWLLL